jgi:hypothetical protein
MYRKKKCSICSYLTIRVTSNLVVILFFTFFDINQKVTLLEHRKVLSSSKEGTRYIYIFVCVRVGHYLSYFDGFRPRGANGCWGIRNCRLSRPSWAVQKPKPKPLSQSISLHLLHPSFSLTSDATLSVFPGCSPGVESSIHNKSKPVFHSGFHRHWQFVSPHLV